MRTQVALIFALIITTCFADDAENVAAFISRSNSADWNNVSWHVKQADVDNCMKVSGNCCLVAGIIGIGANSNQLFFFGTATGATGSPNACGTGSSQTQLLVSFTGKTEGDLLQTKTDATGTLDIQDSIGGFDGALQPNQKVSSVILVIDHSSDSAPSYAVKLPSVNTAYDFATAYNVVHLTQKSVFTTADSTTPTSTTPDSTTPDSTTPDSTTPDSTTPDSTTPDSTTPDSTTPDSSIPASTTSAALIASTLVTILASFL